MGKQGAPGALVGVGLLVRISKVLSAPGSLCQRGKEGHPQNSLLPSSPFPPLLCSSTALTFPFLQPFFLFFFSLLSPLLWFPSFLPS